MTFGPDGNLYVDSNIPDRILRYDGITGASLGAFVTAAGNGGLDGPNGLSFGPDGNLYVSSISSDEVFRYNGATGAFIDVFVTAASGGLDTPTRHVFGPAIATCEVNLTGDLNFGTQDPPSGPSIEKTVNISNGELLDAVVSVFGTDWNDGTGPAEMNVGQTRFGLAPDVYGNKTPLPLISSPESLTTVNGGTNSDTFWQLDIVMNAGSETFTGEVQQTVTFGFACQ